MPTSLTIRAHPGAMSAQAVSATSTLSQSRRGVNRCNTRRVACPLRWHMRAAFLMVRRRAEPRSLFIRITADWSRSPLPDGAMSFSHGILAARAHRRIAGRSQETGGGRVVDAGVEKADLPVDTVRGSRESPRSLARTERAAARRGHAGGATSGRAESHTSGIPCRWNMVCSPQARCHSASSGPLVPARAAGGVARKCFGRKKPPAPQSGLTPVPKILDAPRQIYLKNKMPIIFLRQTGGRED